MRFALGLAVLIAVLLLVTVLLFTARSDSCIEAGGHMFGTGGRWLCLSSDGRVLER
jgi:hypothetical protein